MWIKFTFSRLRSDVMYASVHAAPYRSCTPFAFWIQNAQGLAKASLSHLARRDKVRTQSQFQAL